MKMFLGCFWGVFTKLSTLVDKCEIVKGLILGYLTIKIIDFAYKFFQAYSIHIFSHNLPPVFRPPQFG